MSQVTFGNCFVNSSDSLNGMSKPVSKYAFRMMGSVPQSGPAATGSDGVAEAGAVSAGPLGVTAGVADPSAPGEAHAATRIAATAMVARRAGTSREEMRCPDRMLSTMTPPLLGLV